MNFSCTFARFFVEKHIHGEPGTWPSFYEVRHQPPRQHEDKVRQKDDDQEHKKHGKQDYGDILQRIYQAYLSDSGRDQ
jgi:hypothetical protein